MCTRVLSIGAFFKLSILILCVSFIIHIALAIGRTTIFRNPKCVQLGEFYFLFFSNLVSATFCLYLLMETNDRRFLLLFQDFISSHFSFLFEPSFPPVWFYLAQDPVITVLPTLFTGLQPLERF